MLRVLRWFTLGCGMLIAPWAVGQQPIKIGFVAEMSGPQGALECESLADPLRPLK